MADTLLSPVLSLHVEPKREPSSVGSKGSKDIVTERLEQQRHVLSNELNKIYRRRAQLPVFGGKIQLVARMFDDSLAPTKTPNYLFSPKTKMRLVAPMQRGYLIEAELEALPELIRFVQTNDTMTGQVDISCVEHVHVFGHEDVLRGRNASLLWEQAPDYENGKGFLLSFAPFHDNSARENLMRQLLRYAEEEVLLSTSPPARLLHSSDVEDADIHEDYTDSQSSLAIGLRNYRNTGRARTVVQIASKEALSRIIASGTVFRVDPVSRIAGFALRKRCQ